MRSVPVGAGRRKNKSVSSKYCHLSISEALQAARIDLPNGLHHPHKLPEAGLKINGTVLNFGTDSPLCESMASMMNLAENKVPNGTQTGIRVHCRNGENVDDHSSGSSTVTTSSSKEEGGLKGVANSMHQLPQNIHGFNGQQVPCFPGFQLAYGWNQAVPMPPPPPGFFPSATFPPMPFYPASYWNGPAIPWNFHWVSPNSLSSKGLGLNPTSPTLGKHSRDEDSLKSSSEADKSPGSPKVLVPKTLRIDDPEEAAKSSIWTTLGIKNVEPAGNGGFFKGLQTKSLDKKHKMESFPVLNANPAALARSISFQETA